MVCNAESYAVQGSFELIEKQLPDGGKADHRVNYVGANVMNLTVLRNSQQLRMFEVGFWRQPIDPKILPDLWGEGL